MELILFALISLIVIVGLLISRLNDNSFPFPFDSKDKIYTPAEKNFQKLLEQAVGNKYRVLNRVKLADVVSIRKGVSKRSSQQAITNANNKYLDFVIVEKDTMKLIGAIDLVDTKGKGYKVKKDWFISGALEAASIKHLRIKVKATYTVNDIKNCVQVRLFNGIKPTPKIQGTVIPAALVKARSKNSGVLPASALEDDAIPAQLSAPKMPAHKMAALPH